jgi:hypothetical protein
MHGKTSAIYHYGDGRSRVCQAHLGDPLPLIVAKPPSDLKSLRLPQPVKCGSDCVIPIFGCSSTRAILTQYGKRICKTSCRSSSKTNETKIECRGVLKQKPYLAKLLQRRI